MRREAAVTTQTLDVKFERGIRVEQGMAVLQGESLLGWIEHAGTHTARVRLLTDPQTTMSVAVVSSDGESKGAPTGRFWLRGRGAGRMAVIQVVRKYVQEGRVKVGDVVVTSPDSDRLPVPMVVGTITEIAADPSSSLLCTLLVKPAVSEQIRRVYVLDQGPV